MTHKRRACTELEPEPYKIFRSDQYKTDDKKCSLNDQNTHSISQQIVQEVLHQLCQGSLGPIAIYEETNWDQYCEQTQNTLHYQNQMVEIPISGKICLLENSKFPYQREPISINTSLDYFMLNKDSFRNFKKVMLKNVKLKLVKESFTYYGKCSTCHDPVESPHEHIGYVNKIIPSFFINCTIESDEFSGKIQPSVLLESTMILSNILLDKPQLWRAVYDKINESNFKHNEKNTVFLTAFNNLFECFILFGNLDLAVSVEKNGEVNICNIFHNYFTR